MTAASSQRAETTKMFINSLA